MKSLAEHALQLRVAIQKAVAAHGAPNTFTLGELHQEYGGPIPTVAGRAAKKWLRLDGVSIRDGIVIVDEAVVVCYACEHSFAGPGDGKCPACGAEGGIEDHAVRVVEAILV